MERVASLGFRVPGVQLRAFRGFYFWILPGVWDTTLGSFFGTLKGICLLDPPRGLGLRV